MKRSVGCRPRWMIGIVLCAAALVPPLASVAREQPRTQARSDVTRFRKRVDAILATTDASRTYWGILVADRNTGKILYQLNADRFFEPASNAKLFVTAMALATLGPDYRFRTTLESDAAPSSDGRLTGDLILVGRGDPDLSNRKFPYAGNFEREGPADKVLGELADAAVAKGLREVDGNIVADDSYFPYDPYPAGWTVGDLFFDYGAPVSAIAFNDNVVSVEVRPGARSGDPAEVSTEPEAAIETLARNITTSPANSQPEIAVVRQPGDNFLLLRGTIPAGHEAVRVDLAMTAPAKTAALALKELLEARGVRVTGGIVVRHAPPPETTAAGEPILPRRPPVAAHRVVLAEHMSPPLAQSVRMMNKVSLNLDAELLLRTVGRDKLGVGSTAAGLKVERAFLKSAGIPDGEVLLEDGSGLSRNDLITPRAVVTLLRYAAKQSWRPQFIASLPVAGVDGTLKDRMKGTVASGRIEAKTGSMDHVHSLSGYATTLRGEPLAFSILCNNDTEKGTDATNAPDEIAAAMVETLGKARGTK